MFVVDDAHEVVVELCAGEVGVVGGVVALAAQDGDELGAGLEEAAALADGLEPAVGLEGPEPKDASVAPAQSMSRIRGFVRSARWCPFDSGAGLQGGRTTVDELLDQVPALQLEVTGLAAELHERFEALGGVGIAERSTELLCLDEEPTDRVGQCGIDG